MIKERMNLFRTMLYAVEIALAAANFFAVYFMLDAMQRQGLLLFGLQILPIDSLNRYLGAFWLALVIWAFLLRLRGEYERMRLQGYLHVVGAYLFNGLIFLVLFAGGAFLFGLQFVSRIFIGVYILTTLAWILCFRLGVLWMAHSARSRGYNYRNILIVGTGRRAQEFLDLVNQHREWGYRIVGFLDKDAKMVGGAIKDYKVLGVLEDLPGILEKQVIDEVVFVVPRAWLSSIDRYILYCESVGVPATLSTDFFDLEIAAGVPKEIQGFTFLTFETSRLKETELVFKRLFDVVVSLVALAFASPLLLVTAAFIKLTSKGPVFFKQERCGKNGRRFTLYKFRSMVVDAEARLEELKALNEMSGPVFKIKNDPRLTRIGKFIRKTSIDEFPQFWNVLKGDMSIVGPRPPLPSEVQQYQPWHRRRLSMKPGITCIWQVSGRNEIDFDQWMRLDLQYIDRWSLWLDVKILFQTVKAVFSARGAR